MTTGYRYPDALVSTEWLAQHLDDPKVRVLHGTYHLPTAKRDAGAEFAAAGAMVVGVSKDSAAKHDKFVAKHALGVALVSDEDSDLCERYGVWVEKSMYGKSYMGIERASFLIDGAGVVRAIWRKVKVPGHAAEVLDAVKAL